MMMTHDQFNNYFSKAQQLSACMQEDHNAQGVLLQLVEKERHGTCENLPYEEFLKGEQAFFSKKYKHALQHYLRAKSIPHFKLFCYRASAYVANSTEDYVRALNFAKRALEEFPDDYMSLLLLEKLLTSEGHSEEAQEIRHRMLALQEKGRAACGLDIAENNQADQSQASLSCKGKEFKKFQSAGACTSEPSTESPQELHAVALRSSKNLGAAEIHAHERRALSSKFSFKQTAPQASPLGSSMRVFTSLGSKDPTSTATLTQRLYSIKTTQNLTASNFMIHEQHTPKAALKMASIKEIETFPKNLQETHTAHNPSTHIFNQEESSEAILEQSIGTFHKQQSERIAHYLEQYHARPALNNYCLYLLHGWSDTANRKFMLTEHSRKSSGGYYFRWNGKGIVINPGMHFLDNFHRQGLYIKDIDYVIVTKDHPSSYTDVKEIYALNYQLNQISSELQVIHYYLNPKAFQALSSTLKPHFKQERYAIHCLELFQDSPDVEHIELSEGIGLTYFSLGKAGDHFFDSLSKSDHHLTASSSLGVRFDLSDVDSTGLGLENPNLRLGYVSGAPWSPLLGQHLERCDLLVTGFGSTSPSDYGKIKYNEDSLGFFGTYSLLEEISPRLLLCGEFDGKEGDIRIEIVNMMRQLYAAAYPDARHASSILPVDSHLFLDLLTLHLQCSVSKTFIDPVEARIVKCASDFGSLQYVSPRCCI